MTKKEEEEEEKEEEEEDFVPTRRLCPQMS
jgi:hypothetical protein